MARDRKLLERIRQTTQRDLVDVLEEVREIILGSHGQKAELKWHLDLSRVFPKVELKASKLQKILRFVQHRLPSED